MHFRVARLPPLQRGLQPSRQTVAGQMQVGTGWMEAKAYIYTYIHFFLYFSLFIYIHPSHARALSSRGARLGVCCCSNFVDVCFARLRNRRAPWTAHLFGDGLGFLGQIGRGCNRTHEADERGPEPKLSAAGGTKKKRLALSCCWKNWVKACTNAQMRIIIMISRRAQSGVLDKRATDLWAD